MKPTELYGRRMDELNAALEEAEDAMFEANMSAAAAVPFGDGEQLAWRKMGSDWGLAVVHQNGDHCPLLRASAGRRVAAVSSLPALLAACLESRDECAREAERATAGVRMFIDQVRSLNESDGTPK